tara:strand:+ start:5965 stop:7017 length:1053 start_codon:yes stop_codon:yes gene_type:complete
MIRSDFAFSFRSTVHRAAAGGLFTLAVVSVAWGCAANRSEEAPTTDSTALDLARTAPDRSADADRSVAGQPDRAVVIDGSTLDWATLRTPLAEAAGALVLEEIVLDRSLEREAARAGVRVGETEIRAEEASLLEEIASVSSGQSRMEVLEQIRRSRGLGPVRYESLLRRNALLRALVRAGSEPDPAELELARRLAFGETRRVRLFVSSSEALATRARTEALAAPAESRVWVFAEQAALHSTHPTSARGGLVERFHTEDPAYPSIVGNAAAALEPGGLSSVLSTAGGFAVVLVESVQAGRAPEAGEAERVSRRLRQRKERLAMERLARELIERARVSPVDPDLARAWRDRR